MSPSLSPPSRRFPSQILSSSAANIITRCICHNSRLPSLLPHTFLVRFHCLRTTPIVCRRRSSRPIIPQSLRSANSSYLSREAHTTALKNRRLSSSDEVDGDDENKMETKTKASSNGGRRRGRGGGTCMEESSCSQVNGRGRRCGQQTLVGYSLCDHHLGKGRLQSMMNVRSRSMIGVRETSGKGSEKLEAMNSPTGIDPEPSLPSGLKEGNSLMYNNAGENDDEEEKISAAKGKKKARSMSSLLGQSPNHSNKHGVSTMSFIVERKDL